MFEKDNYVSGLWNVQVKGEIWTKCNKFRKYQHANYEKKFEFVNIF